MSVLFFFAFSSTWFLRIYRESRTYFLVTKRGLCLVGIFLFCLSVFLYFLQLRGSVYSNYFLYRKNFLYPYFFSRYFYYRVEGICKLDRNWDVDRKLNPRLSINHWSHRSQFPIAVSSRTASSRSVWWPRQDVSALKSSSTPGTGSLSARGIRNHRLVERLLSSSVRTGICLRTRAREFDGLNFVKTSYLRTNQALLDCSLPEVAALTVFSRSQIDWISRFPIPTIFSFSLDVDRPVRFHNDSHVFDRSYTPLYIRSYYRKFPDSAKRPKETRGNNYRV